MRRALPLFCVVLVSLSACATGQRPGPSRQETAVSTFRARVKAVDPGTRVVTLVDETGDELTFRADEGVRNLDQVKAGNVLEGKLVESLLIEARAATEDEKSAPVQLAEARASAEPGEKPAGLFVRQLKSVFTIASIDKAAGGGELRDAEGGLHFVKARDPSVLERLKVGETVVVTYTEALRLEVVAPGP